MATNSDGDTDRSRRVSVAVRVRPLIGQELSERCNECISACPDDRKQVSKAGFGGSGVGFFPETMGGGVCLITARSLLCMTVRTVTSTTVHGVHHHLSLLSHSDHTQAKL
jgi:hypothetical protein